jgi:hypothetical protein
MRSYIPKIIGVIILHSLRTTLGEALSYIEESYNI